MKKKVLCFALTAAMGLSMATSAFAAELNPVTVAKVGSGDVNDDGTLTAKDSAGILQYALDHTYAGTDAEKFVLNEANYDGSIDPGTGLDQITANDAVFVLQDVLDRQTDVYITVAAGVESPVRFTEIINPLDSEGKLTKTGILEFTDKIFSGAYDAELNANVGAVNSFVDKIEFTGEGGNKTNIRTDIGWSKFASAVSGVVSDQDAFAQLENNTKTKRYTSADELKADYEAAKKAFAPSMTAGDVSATGDKIVAITGADFITLSKLNDEGQVVKSMNLNELFQTVADNNLQAYDTVTIDQLQEIFGNKIEITATNPNNGYTNKVTVTIERR